MFKLRYDGTLSNFAFNVNLRHYSKFKSWREFPHDEEHNTESADGRDHKRWMERENKVGNTTTTMSQPIGSVRARLAA